MCTNVMPESNSSLPFADIKRQLNGLDPSTGSLTFTGGEPSIHEDFFDVLRLANQKFPDAEVKVITNARMFAYPDFVKQAKGIRNLSFITELYGSTPHLHDSITLTKGSYEQGLRGMRNLVGNFPVELRMVISKLNLKDTPELAEFYAAEFPSAQRVVIFPIDLVGNAARNRKQVAVKYLELVPHVQQAVDILRDKVPVYLFHIPYCVLDPAYHDYVQGVTVLEHRVALTEICRDCLFEERCPRVWVSYIKHFGTDEFCKVESKKLK
jgi:hypothetical protein